MKSILVCGTGNIALILSYFLQKKYNIVGYLAFKKYIKKKKFNGKPLIPIENAERYFCTNETKIISAIGYLEMNEIRKKSYLFLRKKGFKFFNYFDENSGISNDLCIGKNNFILDNVSINPKVKIGDGNIIWSNSTISHNTKIGNFNWISSGAVISGETKVGSLNFFGSNATVANNTTINNKVFVGANTLVSGNLKSSSTYINSVTKKINIDSTNFLKFLKNNAR